MSLAVMRFSKRLDYFSGKKKQPGVSITNSGPLVPKQG
jgi:hypothetical protein